MTQKRQSTNYLKGVLKSPKTTTYVFVGISMVGLVLLAQRVVTNQIKTASLETGYQSLLSSVSDGGIANFQNEKNSLKKLVQQVLKDPKSEEEESFAYGIALFLFPDLLPNSNFEKETALTLWAPLEAKIESKPRSAEARMWFEELKSNIWNYENPKVASVGLSPQAEQTLKIYHQLSSP